MDFEIPKRWIIIFLIVIILIAVFFRFWQITNTPPGVYPDEAINGNDALSSLQTHHFKLFYPENNGREGLFIWLISLSFLIFKPSIWAFRIVPAFFGVLTVLGLYFLTKELFFNYKKWQTEIVALLSSFFLAISFWHTNFSRIGFRAILVPLFIVFGFYFLFRGFRLKKYYLFIISGIFLGLGFYTYIAYRLAVLLLITTLLGWWLVYKKGFTKEDGQRKFFTYSAYLLLSIFFVVLPIGIYFLQNPAQFFGRAAGVSILSQGNPFFNFLKSLTLHLGMFNFRGDNNWRHNFSGAPELLWPIGLLFLFGFILSFKKLIFSFKNKKYYSLLVHSFLIFWFFFLLLPGALSYEGIPHSLRVLGVVPVVYIFASLAFLWVLEKIGRFEGKFQKALIYISLAIFLFSLGFVQFNKYFYQWAERLEVKGVFAANYVQIGKYLNTLPNNIDKYVLVNGGGVPVPYPNGIPMPAQTPIFIERLKFGQPRAKYLLPKNLSEIKINNRREIIIIPLKSDLNLFVSLEKHFKGGGIFNQDGITFYKVNED